MLHLPRGDREYAAHLLQVHHVRASELFVQVVRLRPVLSQRLPATLECDVPELPREARLGRARAPAPPQGQEQASAGARLLCQQARLSAPRAHRSRRKRPRERAADAATCSQQQPQQPSDHHRGAPLLMGCCPIQALVQTLMANYRRCDEQSRVRRVVCVTHRAVCPTRCALATRTHGG